MGLREIAENDLGFILEDVDRGGAWPITVTNPAGVSAALTGFSGDIGQVIDPDTGMAVSGRQAHVTLRVSTLVSLGLSRPEGVADDTAKPWVVQFNDINGTSYTYKVIRSMPDRTAGMVSCLLGLYE